MHAKLLAALSRRHLIGILVAGAAGLALTDAAARSAVGDSRRPGVANLEVDGRSDEPLGVDDTTPRLSWQVTSAPRGWMQAAYQIRAARTVAELASGPYLWNPGAIFSAAQNDIPWGGSVLQSRQRVVWQVSVWSTRGEVTAWSTPATWEMGLLERGDWGAARWIEAPGRAVEAPLPMFARAFTVEQAPVTRARLYVSALGIYHAELNGEPVTDEVLAPGNSNYQLSLEYRTYDVTRLIRAGDNTLGIALGHGTALVTRSIGNPATGRTAPYSWWQSQFKGSGTLAAPAAAGDNVVRSSSVTGYHVGGTINIDTGDGGERLESRTITAIGTGGADGTGIAFTPPLGAAHALAAAITGSGNPIASVDPSAGAAVTPRMIARLEIAKADGSVDAIVSDRSWKAALGPTVTDNWFSGTDHDARREQWPVTSRPPVTGSIGFIEWLSTPS